ncbi:MAG: DUF1778 domain-containing protein [Aeromicrobium sp.]|uniref:type II toxin-antitoxin system TacA family antitoxin n=1 Tax=Aeromicrobium sp. TaxID=1871063 RepID=UPI0039E3086E
MTNKSERIQLRVSSEAKSQITEAAALTQQDTTSFILDAATSRARSVLIERHLLRLSTADIRQIEEALDTAHSGSPELRALFAETRRVSDETSVASG